MFVIYFLLIAAVQMGLTYFIYSLRFTSGSGFVTADFVLFLCVPVVSAFAFYLVLVASKRVGRTWAFRRTLIAVTALVFAIFTSIVAMALAVNALGE